MKKGDVVRVKNSWQSYNYDRCIGYDLHGETGVIVEILSAKDKVDGYRVKFPAITIWNEEGKEKQIKDFIWPFRKENLEHQV